MIDQTTIDLIMNSADVVDVVGDFVALKRRGINFVACCPFHDEKTPSFSVSRIKGIYKCFGCGKAGNAVNFLMEHERLSYVDAIKYLGKKYGIDVKEREQSETEIIKNSERESMMMLSAFAGRFFIDTLNNTEEGKAIGLSYFKERGFDKTVIDKFMLGYSPSKRSAFSDEALKSGYKAEFLIKTGLSIEREDGTLYDRFAGRVIFPIHSLGGRIIAFGGRTLSQDKRTAKYLNSPESDIYLKRNNLYGIFFAKNAIAKHDKSYLVEGYTDVISMFRAGIENVVASSGTSLTDKQIKLLARFSDKVTVLFDGDEAGIKASVRGIDMLLKQGLKVKVILLPDGHDPDSFSRTGNFEDLKNFLDSNEQDFLSFKTKLLKKEGTSNDPIKKSEAVRDIVGSIAAIPDSITRNIYIKECSRELQIDESVLTIETAKLRRENYTAERNATKPESTETDHAATPTIPTFVSNIYCQEQEKELIMYMLRFGREELFRISDNDENCICIDEYIISEIKNDNLQFENLHYKSIFEEYDRRLKESDSEPLKYFINHNDSLTASVVGSLLMDKYAISRFWNGSEHVDIDKIKAVPKAIIVYKKKIVEIFEHKNSERIKDAEANGEDITELLTEKIIISDTRKMLAEKIDRIIG